tara:strand:+ start:246 stop:467 length:222 start_codon:yes stop_codon:yes gene_type:complete
MHLKYITLKTSVQKIIDNTIHGYRMGVWDGFYGHEYKEDVSKGIDSIVYNYLYNKGYSFGDFLKQTDEEWENV